MLSDAPFSPTLERWSEISDFPEYQVSDWGNVRNNKSGRIISATRKPSGHLMVGLTRDKKLFKRSLALLVALAFVAPHPNLLFDTVIHKDGDENNNYFMNLLWRPVWFARKYKIQFRDEHLTYDEPIEDVETHIVHKDSFSAAIEYGLLDHHIVIAMQTNSYVWPTGQVFRAAL